MLKKRLNLAASVDRGAEQLEDLWLPKRLLGWLPDPFHIFGWLPRPFHILGWLPRPCPPHPLRLDQPVYRLQCHFKEGNNKVCYIPFSKPTPGVGWSQQQEHEDQEHDGDGVSISGWATEHQPVDETGELGEKPTPTVPKSGGREGEEKKLLLPDSCLHLPCSANLHQIHCGIVKTTEKYRMLKFCKGECWDCGATVNDSRLSARRATADLNSNAAHLSVVCSILTATN